ncbi:hypothetical protein [Pelagibacterium sp.]|uniref:hypothetical protein n=1 Tax=Pelagibacterium sp. TaxID=1967288 RepID=UPI003BAAD838
MIDPGFWAEFLIRAAATGFVVVFVAWSAARLGPAIGGVLAGLPIVLAPGFYFLVRDQSPSFVADMAAGTLFSMIATQAFLFVYLWAAGRVGPIAATMLAIAGWTILALPLALVSHDIGLGVLAFAGATVLFRLVGRRLAPALNSVATPTQWPALIVRGVAAGILVGVVTLLSPLLGPSLAGALLGFPIGFCVILLSLNLDHGSAIAGRTAYAGLLGVASLATFSAVLSVALLAMPPWSAYVCALAASLVLTASMTHMTRRLALGTRFRAL